MLCDEGAEALIHCGDLNGPEIVRECAVLPLYFTFGNHDADNVPYLQAAATEFGANCLNWSGEVTLNGKRIAIVHGHLTFDLRPLLENSPDYMISGHSHIAGDWMHGTTRRICPAALHRADKFSVALLNLKLGDLRFLAVE